MICIAYLNGMQIENALPLGADTTGFINFQTSQLPAHQINESLLDFGVKHDLEIYQLSATDGVLKTEIVSRGANQLSFCKNYC
ncbi:hypothetical protein BM477_05880 [Boudabousia marimammalium]|uniref:Uncharacterized protein n=1 Tax=Boudabousia marimammalium TaxID=156892 RepID=A0A1Q5PMG8_9ACTO|nr:hypothetical protein BM477_05880 [Boudabousia marimammalium]